MKHYRWDLLTVWVGSVDVEGDVGSRRETPDRSEEWRVEVRKRLPQGRGWVGTAAVTLGVPPRVPGHFVHRRKRGRRELTETDRKKCRSETRQYLTKMTHNQGGRAVLSSKVFPSPINIKIEKRR